VPVLARLSALYLLLCGYSSPFRVDLELPALPICPNSGTRNVFFAAQRGGSFPFPSVDPPLSSLFTKSFSLRVFALLWDSPAVSGAILLRVKSLFVAAGHLPTPLVRSFHLPLFGSHTNHRSPDGPPFFSRKTCGWFSSPFPQKFSLPPEPQPDSFVEASATWSLFFF